WENFDDVLATVTLNDPDHPGHCLVATIYWGDGTSSEGTLVAVEGQDGTYDVQGEHTYDEAGAYLVRVVIGYNENIPGTTTYATAIVTEQPLTTTPATLVTSVPPSLGLSLYVPTGLSNVVVARFTDANPLATADGYTVTIAWGDGTSGSGEVLESDGEFFVVGS